MSNWGKFENNFLDSKNKLLGKTVRSVDGVTDIIDLVAGNYITITPSTTAKTITFAVTQGAGGVISVNSLVGALTLAAGSGMVVSDNGSNTITFATGSITKIAGLLNFSGGLGCRITASYTIMNSETTITGSLMVTGSHLKYYQSTGVNGLTADSLGTFVFSGSRFRIVNDVTDYTTRAVNIELGDAEAYYSISGSTIKYKGFTAGSFDIDTNTNLTLTGNIELANLYKISSPTNLKLSGATSVQLTGATNINGNVTVTGSLCGPTGISIGANSYAADVINGIGDTLYISNIYTDAGASAQLNIVGSGINIRGVPLILTSNSNSNISIYSGNGTAGGTDQLRISQSQEGAVQITGAINQNGPMTISGSLKAMAQTATEGHYFATPEGSTGKIRLSGAMVALTASSTVIQGNLTVSGGIRATVDFVASDIPQLAVGNMPTGTPILLYCNEADGSAINTTAAKQGLWFYTIPKNDYSYIMMETTIRSKADQDTIAKPTFTYAFNQGATIYKTFAIQITETSDTGADGGGAHIEKYSHMETLTTATYLTCSGQMSVSNANVEMQVLNYRIWGIV